MHLGLSRPVKKEPLSGTTQATSIETEEISPPANPEDVLTILDTLSPILLIAVDKGLVRRAVDARVTYGLHFWDCMIIVAAERAGCERLWSEDLNSGQKYFGVTVTKSFCLNLLCGMIIEARAIRKMCTHGQSSRLQTSKLACLSKDSSKKSGQFLQHAFLCLVHGKWRLGAVSKEGSLTRGERQINKLRRMGILCGIHQGRSEFHWFSVGSDLLQGDNFGTARWALRC